MGLVPGALIGAPELGVAGVGIVLDIDPADAVFHGLTGLQALQDHMVQAAEDATAGEDVVDLGPALQLYVGHARDFAGPQDRKRGITGIGDPGTGLDALGAGKDRKQNNSQDKDGTFHVTNRFATQI